MSELAGELRKLAKLKRNAKNFEKIQDTLAEVRGYVDEAGEFPATVAAAVTALGELRDLIGQTDADNPLVNLSMNDVEAALALLPGGESGAAEEVSISSLVEEAETAASDYEEIADDRQYDATNRNEAFDELCNRVENIANWLDPKGAPKNG